MKWLVNWFSNMEPFDTPMLHESDGIVVEYLTVEHFYQAMKIYKSGMNRKLFIEEYPTPYDIKKAARKLPMREDWEDVKESVMWTALQWKFRKGTMWADTLISTYAANIVEWNNWHDNYWGWCICTRCQRSVLAPNNRLGKMLEQIREDLLCE